MIARGGSVLVPAAGAALALNLVLFAVAALLARERPLRFEMSDPVPVSLVSLRPPVAPPPAEPEPSEPRPEPEPRQEFLPTPSQPLPNRPDLPATTVKIDLGGLDLAPARGAFIFEATDLDRPPREIARVNPVYPFKARQRNIQGTVRVKFLVDATGSVSRVEVLASEPKDLFDAAVLQVVPRWRYEPGQLDGRAVPAWVATDIIFEMD